MKLKNIGFSGLSFLLYYTSSAIVVLFLCLGFVYSDISYYIESFLFSMIITLGLFLDCIIVIFKMLKEN